MGQVSVSQAKLLQLHDGEEVLGVLVEGDSHADAVHVGKHGPVMGGGILPAFEGVDRARLHIVGPHDVFVVVNALLVMVVNGLVGEVRCVLGLHFVRIGLGLGLQVVVEAELTESVALAVLVGFLNHLGGHGDEWVTAGGFGQALDLILLYLGGLWCRGR